MLVRRRQVGINALYPLQGHEEIVQEEGGFQDVLFFFPFDGGIVAGEAAQLGDQAVEDLGDFIPVAGGEEAELRIEAQHLRGVHGVHGVAQRGAQLGPAFALQGGQRPHQPPHLLTRIVVEARLGILGDALEIFLHDLFGDAGIFFRRRADRPRHDPLFLPPDQLLDGADFRKEERGDVRPGAQRTDVAPLECLAEGSRLEELADVLVVTPSNLLHAGGNLARRQLSFHGLPFITESHPFVKKSWQFISEYTANGAPGEAPAIQGGGARKPRACHLQRCPS